MGEEMISRNPEETIALGEEFGKKNLHPGAVAVLRGALGAGKTLFTKGIAKALGLPEAEISSPTYALANEYEIHIPGLDRLYHLDCYRFEKPEELLELGIEEYLYPKHAITVIEWPERIERYLPVHRIEVRFTIIDVTTRKIAVAR